MDTQTDAPITDSNRFLAEGEQESRISPSDTRYEPFRAGDLTFNWDPKGNVIVLGAARRYVVPGSEWRDLVAHMNGMDPSVENKALGVALGGRV